jgi:glycosyltransferase involved in cell wall biosynthesis
LTGELVDDVILVDDASTDDTLEVAGKLGISSVARDRNKGYWANQTTRYRLALERGADIVIMVHRDYQYSPRLLLLMAAMLCSGLFDVALAPRMLGLSALAGGMPRYKHVANRALTLIQNALVGHNLSEYHTGFQAFVRPVLEAGDISPIQKPM